MTPDEINDALRAQAARPPAQPRRPERERPESNIYLTLPPHIRTPLVREASARQMKLNALLYMILEAHVAKK